MALKDKFQPAHDHDWAENKAKAEPGFLFPCFMEASKKVTDWPDDIKPQSSIEGDRNFYTFRVTYDELTKVGALPEIKSITIR